MKGDLVHKANTLLALLMTGCATLGTPQPEAVGVPTSSDELMRCKVAAAHENPIVTEWSSSEKVNLETRSRSGAVLVEYFGCKMRIVPECRASGAYRWQRTTVTTDVVEVQSADDLYANLPLGAANLEGELERSGGMTLRTTVSGLLQLEDFDARRVEADPRCRGATHVVRGIAVGAFRMQSANQLSAGAGVGPTERARVGGSTRHADGAIHQAGSAESCQLATADEPHADCRSPVQVFLSPLPRTVARAGPPGTVNARFLPPDPDRSWKLVLGDRVLCDVPCERNVDPKKVYAFRTEGGFLRPDYFEDVPDLRPHVGAGEVEVRPAPRKTGRLAGGIVMTSLGGIALLTGAVLLGVNCGKSTAGCVAGGVTGGLGATAVAGGVVFIVTSRSKIEVVPATTPFGSNLDGEPAAAW